MQRRSRPVFWHVAINLFDDLVEHLGPEAFPFCDDFVPCLLECLSYPEPDLRQSALFGVGNMAAKGGPLFREHVTKGLPLLYAAVASPEAHSSKHVLATENAIASIVRVFRAGMGDRSMEEFVKGLLSLPAMCHDTIECKYVYDYLLGLAEEGSALLAPHTAQLQTWLARATEAGMLDEPLLQRVAALRLPAP